MNKQLKFLKTQAKKLFRWRYGRKIRDFNFSLSSSNWL